MVSRVAVIALVAIVACPILLGYAMNLSETTVMDYKIADDSVNVTQLLQNDVKYTSVNADTYVINSSLSYVTNPENNPVDHSFVPYYEKLITSKTSLPLQRFNGSIAPGANGIDDLTSFTEYFVVWDHGYNIGSVDVNIYSGSNLIATVSQVKEIYYDKSSDSITYVYGVNNVVNTISGGSYTSYRWTNNSGVTDHTLVGYQYSTGNNRFVDLSAGFHLYSNLNSTTKPAVIMPANTKSFILSINLDSITDSNYSMTVNVVPSLLLTNGIKLVKTTTGGDVTWQYYRGSTLVTDLYYDSNRNDNTYQIIFSFGDPYQYGSSNVRYDTHYELRYVGGWPELIGEANTFMTYSYDGGAIINNNLPRINGIKDIYFSDMTNNRTPTIRIDAAKIDGYSVNVISDQTYSPASFRSNPATTLDEITLYGKSIGFGGNTYTVDDSGNITIGTHKVPLKGIMFSSIQISGGYENRIGNTVISITAQPSNIIFNGSWVASISTASMESYNYTKTEWTPGQFGWDGIDHNFLMVGLLTSLGAFIALGIYIRRTKAALWPLLIVCGGAAMLFFCML